ncbi:MAG: TadE family protein, partial [Bryobacteraceae bacterium]
LKNSARRKRGERGAVIVETSLVFIIFTFMMVGAFDFGQFLFTQQALADRARLAARWGSVSDPTNSSAIQNMVLYGQSTVPVGSGGVFGLTSSNVTSAVTDSGTDNYRLTVMISGYTFSYAILGHLLGAAGPKITVAVPLGLN